MRNLKKALSVFLCAAMMFTTLCFFPLVSEGNKANAAVLNEGSEIAFYVPENIYLYPDVTSWTAAVSTPFQYYVGNTVDTADIYNTPTVNANLDSEGKIYFAAKEGMSDVSLKVRFLNSDGSYMNEADYGTVNFTTENKGTYYLFTVTEGVSPVLQADVSGCYIEWCVVYTNNKGEEKAVFNYSYIYKPYVVPYGAAARVNNTNGQVNVYGQNITWVTGVHSVDNTAAQTNTIYPRYISVAEAVDSSDDTKGEYPFSPFLSRDNKAYVGGVEVSGAANVANGGYNAVFAGTDAETAYFWANQQSAYFTRSYRVREFFYTTATSATYPVAFDYMNNASVATQYALSQVTPTRLGYITVDTSRYDNLNEIPNLAVGMIVTDTDVKDAVTTNTAQATAQWYIGDATGKEQLATGAYDSVANITAAQNAVYVKFASGKNLTAPLDRGIWYAGAWDKALNNSAGVNTYTVKSYYEAQDREGDRQAVSSAVSLNVNQVDKSVLRAAVDNATSYSGVLGIKENWNSYYYDINYIDPDTGNSAWDRFRTAYKNACEVLGNVNASYDYEYYAGELNAALDALLSGKGLRVYFDVNHDDIGVNLWINPNTSYYVWNAADETAVINGNFYASVTFGTTAFTPDAGVYTMSATQVAGSFNKNGCAVFDSVKADGNNALKSDGTTRYNFDFKGTSSKVMTYEEETYMNVDGIKFWAWYNENAGTGAYDNFTVRLKIEKGSTPTEYSPVGKVVGTTYGTLPAPEREGYLFAGWYTDNTLTTVVDENSQVTSRILYAKWEKAQYNVVFDGNGADGGEMAEQTFTYDEKANLRMNGLTRTGYVFAGWTDDKGNNYADGAEVMNLTSEHQGKYTLYAQWTPNQYSVAFDGNTGLGGLGMTNAQYDTPFSLPANYFIKTGYTFIGWSVSPDGEVIYGDKAEVKNLTSEVNGSVTLYAVWQANTFTVKFDKNTGSGEMADAQVVYDSEAALPECAFTKTGYTFIGWSLAAEGGELITSAQYDNLMTEEGDEVTLYAVWSENSYTLNLDANGGEGEKIPATIYNYEASVILPKNVFTKEGYVLSGWSFTKDGEKVYENGETVTHINSEKNGNVTLYAVWTPVNYTVSFDANTGLGTMDGISMVYDVDTTLPLNSFTKEGYHFIGWSTAANGQVVYKDGVSVRNLTATDGKNVVLYAVWEINTYTVTFTYRIPSGTEVSVPVIVEHGSAAKIPSDFVHYPQYTATQHYVFLTWNEDFSSVTADIAVKARYASDKENHTMLESVTDSTCDRLGSILHYCEKCSYSYTEDIDLKEHSWDSGSTEVEPGCVTNGEFVYHCYNCTATKADAIDPVGHDFVPFEAKEPSCSEEGNIEHKHCERCEKCYATDAAVDTPYYEALDESEVKIAKLPHTPPVGADCRNEQTCTVCGEAFNVPHTYDEAVTAPDCTNGGYTIFTCSVCGHSYRGNEVDANGHTEGEWTETVAPGCNTLGTEVNKCSICRAEWKTRDIEATGHDSGAWEVATPAGCETWGIEALRCTVCKTTITTRGISPKGHGETKLEVTLEAGCETAGRESKLCVDCNTELGFNIIPEKGHTPGAAATCETDQICTVCTKLLNSHTGHAWDEGKVTKQATDKEEGEITYTCQNDNNHKRTEKTPLNTTIILPELPVGGTYKLDADENGNGGNIYDIVTIEEGTSVYFLSSDHSVLTVDFDGNITVLAEGSSIITIRYSDNSYERVLPVTTRMLRTVVFSANGKETVIKAYRGDKVTPPAVESYKDADGFNHAFKAWTLGGAETENFTVTGDMTFVAIYTTGCDYREIDRLEGLLDIVLSGIYDNNNEIILNKDGVTTAKALIAEYKNDRETRDISNQAALDAACKEISDILAKLYPVSAATVEIRGNLTPNAGSVTAFKAYLMPIDTELSDCVWTSSDDAVGFFSDGKFYAIGAGTVTITVTSDKYTGSAEITVAGGAGSRVIMFDTLLSNVSYIVEDMYIIKSTANIFWATDAPVRFRIVTSGSFEQYFVYIDDIIVEADANGYYTIPANTGDIHVKTEGVVEDDDGQRFSFWDKILAFFNKIAEFFSNLFNF